MPHRNCSEIVNTVNVVGMIVRIKNRIHSIDFRV